MAERELEDVDFSKNYPDFLSAGPPTARYLVLHTHRHGLSHYLVESTLEPSIEDVLEALPEIDFEPDRDDEDIEIILLGDVDARISAWPPEDCSTGKPEVEGNTHLLPNGRKYLLIDTMEEYQGGEYPSGGVVIKAWEPRGNKGDGIWAYIDNSPDMGTARKFLEAAARLAPLAAADMRRAARPAGEGDNT